MTDLVLEFLRVNTALRVSKRELAAIKRKIKPEVAEQRKKIIDLDWRRRGLLTKIYESYDPSVLDHRVLEDE